MAESHSTSLKTCFKCGEAKARSEFYKHPQMADGLLGKCKECAKKDVRDNYFADIPKRQEYERNRSQRKLRKEMKLEYQRRSRAKHPTRNAGYLQVHRAIASGQITRKPCEVCGDPNSHAHHDDYSKPLDVRWLCRKHHQMHHGKLKYEIQNDQTPPF